MAPPAGPRSAWALGRSARFMFLWLAPLLASAFRSQSAAAFRAPLWSCMGPSMCAVPCSYGARPRPGRRCSAVPMAAPPWRPPPRGGSPSIKRGWYRVHPLKCNIDARQARQPPAAPAPGCRRPGLPSARGAFGTHGAARGPPAPRAGALCVRGGGTARHPRPALWSCCRPIPPPRADPPPLPQRVPSSQGLGWSPCYVGMQPRTIPLRESQGLRKSSRCPMILWRADP